MRAGLAIEIQFVGRSDVGRRRDHNEDSFYYSNADGYGIVCDGMGGHQGGEIASRLAVDVISGFASDVASELVASREFTLGKLKDYAVEQAVNWAKEANIEVFQKGVELSDGAQKRMGTTLCLVMLVADFAVVAHAGDSRIYRFRQGKLERLTKDHVTTVHNHVSKRTGKVRAKKYVTKALGTHPTVTPDCRTVVVRDGDKFLLCSDGLTDLVRDKEIESVLKQVGSQTQLAVRSLIHLANKRGGIDNITVVIGTVVDDDDDEDTDDLSGEMQRVRKTNGAAAKSSGFDLDDDSDDLFGESESGLSYSPKRKNQKPQPSAAEFRFADDDDLAAFDSELEDSTDALRDEILDSGDDQDDFGAGSGSFF